MHCDRIAVAFIDDKNNVIAESAASDLPQVFLESGFREPIGGTTLGAVAESGRPRVINDLEEHCRKVNQSNGTKLILREGINSSLTLPIIIRGRCLGFLFVSSSTPGAYDNSHVNQAEKTLGILKQNIYFHYLVQQIVASTSNAFVRLMERKDNETSLHIKRMSSFSHVIARTLVDRSDEVSATMLREILWFAPLHDIGKIGIPDDILHKPGGLTDDERGTIQQHVEIGGDVIRSMERELSRILGVSILGTAIEIITCHHERFDGKGYPRGIGGEAIPIAGRITAVADVFDALTSRRPYKEAMEIEDAIALMREGVGTQFDPEVFQAFLDSMNDIERIYQAYKEI